MSTRALLFGAALGAPAADAQAALGAHFLAGLSVPAATAATHPVSAPALPSAYEMLISWEQVAAGKTYHYTHKRSYDVGQQVYRDDQMDGDKIVTSTVYRPSDKLAYQFGAGGCMTWDFESRIDGFPPVDGYQYNQTDAVGDEYSKTFMDPAGKKPLYRLDLWFDGKTPVQYRNTADEGAIVGGLKHITEYKAHVSDKDRFTIPKKWGCKKPKVEDVAELMVADVAACSADDATKVSTVKFTCDAVACAKSSFYNGDKTAKCVAAKDGISTGCSSCFGQITECALKNCALHCMTDPTSAGCQSCGHKACDALAKSCTGLAVLPPDATDKDCSSVQPNLLVV